MPYTLWSKGRLIGQTDLDFIANTAETKMGWFHPTEFGEQVMDVMTEPSRVISGWERGGDVDAIRTDLTAAADRIEGLALELVSPEGQVLPVKDIGFNDTHRLLALAAEYENEFEDEEISEELEASIAHDLELLDFDDDPTPWEALPDLPRYQILVFM